MERFGIYQIILSDEDVHAVNAHGWGSHPTNEQFNQDMRDYLTVQRGMNGSGDLKDFKVKTAISRLIHAGRYLRVATIEAEDIARVFEVGNIGPESQITRHSPMKSVSVGDLVTDKNGTLWFCDNFGWTELSEDHAAALKEAA